MDRTVPKTGSEEIQLYMRTYYSLLRSTYTIQIETLQESHMAVESSLHVKARSSEIDVSALVYSSLRLPGCMPDVNYVLLGQVEKAFIDAGYTDVEDWARVSAPARRRRVHFDGHNTLAAFIASRSDIDDLIPILTAYQIEWNKLHGLLRSANVRAFLDQHADRQARLSNAECDELAQSLKMIPEHLQRLENAWYPNFGRTLRTIAGQRKQIGLRLLAGSLADYRRATAYWWDEVREQTQLADLDPEQRPVYFVSSNTHSVINLLTGYAQRNETELIDYIETSGHQGLLDEYVAIRQADSPRSLDNFLYYVLKKYTEDTTPVIQKQLVADEEIIGIHRIPSRHGFEIETQMIEIDKLRFDWLDSRLCEIADIALLKQSDALILNIDYPLGMAAYELLTRISERVGRLLGVYVMGKAATLNGRVGDVMIPNVIHDEHSQNTYLFDNCFTAADVAPYLTYGMVLDNQKAISAPGTFLQNSRYMSVFYHEGYTDIEMEGGPYLSAVYEAFRPKRHPMNEVISLYNLPFDIGCLHYASDTPMSRGQNLGSGSLNYLGVDPTYATAVAILHRIMTHEVQRLRLTPMAKVEVSQTGVDYR